ncbi:MAG: isopropylmalate isomerase [Pseudomonadota bacterium]
MTDETPPDESPENPEKKSKTGRNAAIGAAATIGSAAIAAALLYAGKRFIKKPKDSAIGEGQADKAPSGEPPETD